MPVLLNGDLLDLISYQLSSSAVQLFRRSLNLFVSEVFWERKYRNQKYYYDCYYTVSPLRIHSWKQMCILVEKEENYHVPDGYFKDVFGRLWFIQGGIYLYYFDAMARAIIAQYHYKDIGYTSSVVYHDNDGGISIAFSTAEQETFRIMYEPEIITYRCQGDQLVYIARDGSVFFLSSLGDLCYQYVQNDELIQEAYYPVSYTHLTLPTILLV